MPHQRSAAGRGVAAPAPARSAATLAHAQRRRPLARLLRTLAAGATLAGAMAGEPLLDLQVAPAAGLLAHLRDSPYGRALAALPPTLRDEMLLRLDRRLAHAGLPPGGELHAGLGGIRLVVHALPGGAAATVRVRMEPGLRDSAARRLVARWQGRADGPGRWALPGGAILSAGGDTLAYSAPGLLPEAVAVPTQDLQASLEPAVWAWLSGLPAERLQRLAGPAWTPLRIQVQAQVTGFAVNARAEAGTQAPQRPIDPALLSAVPAHAQAVVVIPFHGPAWIGAVDAWLQRLGIDLDAWLRARGAPHDLRSALAGLDGSLVVWTTPGGGWVLGLPRSSACERLLAWLAEAGQALPEGVPRALAPRVDTPDGPRRLPADAHVLLHRGRCWLASEHLALADIVAASGGAWAEGPGRAAIAWAGPRAVGLGWAESRRALPALLDSLLRQAWQDDPGLPAADLLAALAPVVAGAGDDRWRLLREGAYLQWEGQGPLAGLPLPLLLTAQALGRRAEERHAALGALRLRLGRERSLRNLSSLAAAIRAHDQGAGEAPLDLLAVLRNQVVSVDPACLDSAWLSASAALLRDAGGRVIGFAGEADYAYLRPGREAFIATPQPLLMEDPARSSGHGAALAYSDGHAVWLDEPAASRVWAQFQRLRRAAAPASARDWQAHAGDLRR